MSERWWIPVAGVLLGDDGETGLSRLPSFVIGARLTPYQALATGTKNFGQYLRTLDPHGAETGTIGVGQRADLVLLRGNPLTDIRYAAALDRFWTPQHSINQYFPGRRVPSQGPPELVMIGAGGWPARTSAAASPR